MTALERARAAVREGQRNADLYAGDDLEGWLARQLDQLAAIAAAGLRMREAAERWWDANEQSTADMEGCDAILDAFDAALAATLGGGA